MNHFSFPMNPSCDIFMKYINNYTYNSNPSPSDYDDCTVYSLKDLDLSPDSCVANYRNELPPPPTPTTTP